MRKVRFAQDAFDEKLEAILTEFPILDVSVHLLFSCADVETVSDRICTLSCHR